MVKKASGKFPPVATDANAAAAANATAAATAGLFFSNEIHLVLVSL